MGGLTTTALGTVMYFAQSLSLIVRLIRLLTLSVVDLSFFLLVAWYLLSCESNFLMEFADGFLDIHDDGHIRGILEGVFLYPVCLCLSRNLFVIVVWTFGLCRLPHPFIIGFLSWIITLTPLLSAHPEIVALPWTGYLYWSFSSGSAEYSLWGVLVAVIFLLVFYTFAGTVDQYVASLSYKTIPAWVTGLSVLLGFEAWRLQAFIMGPLIVSIAVLVHDSFRSARHEDPGPPRVTFDSQDFIQCNQRTNVEDESAEEKRNNKKSAEQSNDAEEHDEHASSSKSALKPGSKVATVPSDGADVDSPEPMEPARISEHWQMEKPDLSEDAEPLVSETSRISLRKCKSMMVTRSSFMRGPEKEKPDFRSYGAQARSFLTMVATPAEQDGGGELRRRSEARASHFDMEQHG